MKPRFPSSRPADEALWRERSSEEGGNPLSPFPKPSHSNGFRVHRTPVHGVPEADSLWDATPFKLNISQEKELPMKSSEELNLPESLRYTGEHVWVRMDGGEAVIGISDFAQDQLGEIAFVDLPAVGTRFEAGSDFGTVESLKSVNQLYMPIPGEVVAVNEELESTPTLVNVSPYGEGWMIRIRPDASAESLLDAAGYRALLGL